jgi:hypothetical protein
MQSGSAPADNTWKKIEQKILEHMFHMTARQTCLADLPGRLARKTCPEDLPGRLARQTCHTYMGIGDRHIGTTVNSALHLTISIW